MSKVAPAVTQVVVRRTVSSKSVLPTGMTPNTASEVFWLREEEEKNFREFKTLIFVFM